MIDRIEYSITDNCNLNCAYCCHYAPIATKYFVRLDKFEDDITQLAILTNQGKDLGTLGLLGGEPLLHPNLIEMCYHARIMLPYSRVRITTNGLLLKKLSKPDLCCLRRFDIEVLISKYRDTDNFDEMVNLLEEYKIVHKFCQNNNLIQFAKYGMDETGSQDKEESHNNCELWKEYYTCHELREGKLYPCSQIARATVLNKRFGTNFKVTDNDYINIYKHNLAEIEEFLKHPVDFCKYCKTKSWNNNVGTWKLSTKQKEEFV